MRSLFGGEEALQALDRMHVAPHFADRCLCNEVIIADRFLYNEEIFR